MRQKILLLLLSSSLCLVLAEVQAAKPSTTAPEEAPVGKKLYKWVDREGNVSYRDQLPPEGSDYKVEERPIRYGSPVVKKKADPNAKVAEKYPVVLYSVPNCGSCDLARIYLQKREVPFTEKNADNDLKIQEELKKKTGALTAPTILIGEKIMKGYLESLLEGELDQAGYAGAKAPAADGGSTGPKPKPSP
ncbi:MAG TPA: glutaredoxin domain-containing protein [Burkholderiales bacterium]|nr:glutaredoxin domain-containing protein [Burkholderiales bacterium]